MSNINLTTLKSADEQASTYRDITLDMKTETNVKKTSLYRSRNVTDLALSKDEHAIQNSLYNIFNTTPGEKILTPDFGLDLRQYLFDPLSEDIAQNIGDNIIRGLQLWEPRVVVNKVDIMTDYDQNQYIISLYIAIPTLNISEVTYTGELNTEGFTFKLRDE
jgi:phage baseplate assembly protein W